jgi:hypothetical protein
MNKLSLDAAIFQSNPRAIADLHAAEAAFWYETGRLLKAAQTFRTVVDCRGTA